jgi:hypothetical protein
MQEILILLVSFSAVFGLGIVIAKSYLTFRAKPRKDAYTPVDNAKVRIKTSTALYRCRHVSTDTNGWVFTAPMHRDNYVPVSVGEEITCEVVARGGVLLFATKVIARKAIEGTIVVAVPKSVKLDDRRDKTDRAEVEMEVVVSGKTGEVMDISPSGARVKIQGFEREGNMVRIDLPSG